MPTTAFPIKANKRRKNRSTGIVVQENDGNGVWWAICAHHHPQQLLGACGVYEIDHYNRNADIGYWLSPAQWGQGVMQECLKKVFEYAFGSM